MEKESNEMRSGVTTALVVGRSAKRLRVVGVELLLLEPEGSREATSGWGLSASGGVGEADVEASPIASKLGAHGGGEGLSWARMILLARTDDGSGVKFQNQSCWREVKHAAHRLAKFAHYLVFPNAIHQHPH